MASAKRWPLNKAYFWETAPFFRLLLPFAAGILCYDRGWLKLPGLVALTAALLMLVLFALASRFRPSLRVGSFVLVTILLLCLGNACAWYRDVNNDVGWFGYARDSGSPAEDNGNLVSISEQPTLRASANTYIMRIPVEVVCKPGIGHPEWVTGKAIVYVRNEAGMKLWHVGDTLAMPAHWERIRNAGNPFEFDYANYCARNGLYYRQFLDAGDVHLYAPQDPAAIPLTGKTRNWCTAQFDKYITTHNARMLIEAMMLGDEVNLDEDMREAYAETGIIHIIAISGGNVAIFFIVISWLLWWLKDRRHRWVKYAVALPLVWFYVIMAGSSPSAIRAAAMFSVVAFAVMFQKNSNGLNSVFATAFLLLCAQPMWLFSLGFQLSFLAVLSLIVFYRYVHRWWAPVRWWARKLWEVVAASIAAQILVAPLIIYYFHSFPLLFLVANAVAYLFMGAVVVLSIAILVVSWLPVVAGAIGAVLGWLVSIFGHFIGALQFFSPAGMRTLLLSGVELVLVYIVIAAISAFFVRRQKPAVFVALGACCMILLSMCAGRWQRLAQDRLVVYNIAGDNYAEQINGNRYRRLTHSVGYNAKSEYAIAPVHINWQARIRDTAAPAGAYYIAGKLVLILNEAVSSGHFPVDVLVVGYRGEIDAEAIKRVFSPALVVLGGNYSRWQQQQVASAFRNAGVKVHAVGVDGAYVLSK